MTYRIRCVDLDRGREAERLATELAGMASLVVADPPYNYGVDYADDETGDSLVDEEYRHRLLHWITVGSRLLAPGATLVWVSPLEHVLDVGPMLRRLVPGVALTYQGPVIWRESFAQYQQKSMTRDYRAIWFAHNVHAKPVFNADAIRVESARQKAGDKRADPRGRVPGMVWEMRRLQGTSKDRVDWHPAQMPPELYRRLILGWSNPGDTVVDLFAGSGTMGLEAMRAGRKAQLIDKSRTYCAEMQKRLAAEDLECTTTKK